MDNEELLEINEFAVNHYMKIRKELDEFLDTSYNRNLVSAKNVLPLVLGIRAMSKPSAHLMYAMIINLLELFDAQFTNQEILREWLLAGKDIRDLKI